MEEGRRAVPETSASYLNVDWTVITPLPRLTLYVSPNTLYTDVSGREGGCRNRNSVGSSITRGGSSFDGSKILFDGRLCWSRSCAILSSFSVVKSCQNGGGLGKSAARPCCSSMIDVV